jgi:redox-sensitive bicupin YhaK (pirin superfamily)
VALPITRRRALAELAAWSSLPVLGSACESGRSVSARQTPAAREAPLVEVPRIRAVATTDGQGARLHRLFPSPYLQNLDPFVLLDDFDVAPPAGFPTHPHRGFEAFTYMIEGTFHHVDNLGNDSAVSAGGTQRFTSGSGAYHSEMPGGGGTNRGLQLWVNLPRRLKKMPPNYAGLDPSHHPVNVVGGAEVRTIVGRGSDVELQTSVRYHDVSLDEGGVFSDVVEGGWNAVIYVIRGAVEIAGSRFEAQEAALPKSGPLKILASSAARFAFLAGRPHGEPIIHRGPFVD